MIPVILAGGVGSRLWPLSRDLYPKQLLSLIGEQSLLQATISRFKHLQQVKHIIVICGEQHQFLVEEQLDAMQERSSFAWDIILEPIGRNTAPALALAALRAQELHDAMLLAVPADHLIADTEVFATQMELAMHAADEKLVTFGVKPTYPETGYGYIEVDATPDQLGCCIIKRFVEKPDRLKAESYLEQDNYYWNSGVFLFRASTYISELNEQVPEVLEVCEQAWKHRKQQGKCALIDAATYLRCPAISIDYAIMEKTTRGLMFPLLTAWSDIGSWQAVSKFETADEHGNVSLGDVFAIDTYDCYLRSESRLLTAVGVKDHIVIETSDAILVANKAHAQDVKILVEQLKARQRKEAQSHATLYHPWGHFDILSQGEDFIVEQVTVKPNSCLSATTKSNVCEHWVVLLGEAEMRFSGQVMRLSSNHFADILPNTQYMLINPTNHPLKLLNIRTTIPASIEQNQQFYDQNMVGNGKE